MDAIWNIEIEITLFFQNLGAWLTTPMVAISFLATEYFFMVIMPLVYWCVDSLMGLRLAIMLVISDSMNNFFKMLFHTPRPFWFDTRVDSLSQETGFGLPSGHSQNSASLWGMMAASVKKKWFTIVALIVILLVGISRIYLGMHFLHDVLSGWLIAGVLLWIYLKLEKPVAKWLAPKRLSIQILYAFLFSIVIIIPTLISISVSEGWQMPAAWITTAAATGGATPDPFNFKGVITLGGVAFGFLTGYAWLVKKYGQPKVEGTWLQRLIRYFVGIIGVIALYAGLKMVFPEEPLFLGLILRYVRYALIGLWVSAVAPILFKKLKLDK